MSEKPNFSLAYTSVRAQAIPNVVKLWNDRSKFKDLEWVIAVDDGDAESAAAAVACNQAVMDKECRSVTVVVNSGSKDCVTGWNLAASKTTGKVIICVSDDFLPPQDWDALLLALKPEGWTEQEKVVHVNDGYVFDILVLVILTRLRYERYGYVFYPKYQSMFCLPPDSRVYMANQTFKRLDQVQPGDLVVGSERRRGKKDGTATQSRDFLCVAEVQSVSRRRAPIVRVTLESGNTLFCTPDHLWAYFKGYDCNRPYLKENGKNVKVRGRYVRAQSSGEGAVGYAPPVVGNKLIRACTMPPEPPDVLARELGWLAGIYDGEGSFPVLSQSGTANARVCAEIERVLRLLGFAYSTDSSYSQYSKTSGKVHEQRVYTLLGGRPEYLRFLSWLKPVKNSTEQVRKRMFSARFSQLDTVVDIAPAGVSDVMCLKTSTGNFVADGYLSHNCDTELGSVAYRDGAVIEAMHLMFEHQHPDCHKRVRDTHDLQHASQERWNSGQMLYEFRKKLNYPLDDGPKAAVAVTAAAAAAAPAPGAKTDEYVVYMQVTQDDFCLEEVCVRMVEEGVKTFFWSEPDEYWSGEPIEPQYLTQLFRVQGRLQDRLGERINIYRRTFHVKSYRLPGDSRIAVETRVRNDSLAWIREQGYRHILIVDGDELWTHGTLELVKKFVEQDNTAISIRMVPAIGLPSYPVEQATDVAVVYIGLGDFKVCRSPHTRQTIIPLNRVIHFSGTRRTMEETISKHRRGGHYDDPDYDFETWLREVLPSVKPGFTYMWPNGIAGLHMYKKWQIWPGVRNWRPEELAEIPVSLHAFLGK